MSRTIKLVALAATLSAVAGAGAVYARGFGGGGFRGGGVSAGGFRGGYGGGGFSGGGYRGGGVAAGGFHEGGYSGGGYRGGYGGAGFGGAHTYTAAGSFDRSAGAFRGYNPYSGVHSGGGYSGGSYTGPRGGSVDYGAAGRGVVGPAGGAAGRGVAGVQVTTPGGRTFTDVGRAGGAVGPGGRAVGGRENIAAATGPGGAAVAGSRSGFAAGPGGVVAGGARGGMAAGPGGVVAGGSRGGFAAGPGGVVAGGARGGFAAGGYGAGGYHAYGAYGAAGYRPYGYNAYGGYHAGWVHGYWNGNNSAAWGWRGAYWGLGVGAAAGLGWGLASWGFGSALYGMGYASYANPYYMAPVGVAVATAAPYDYAMPIDTVSAPAAEDVTSQAVAAFDSARGAFRQGDYDGALRLADEALGKTPNDTALHEFRALCLFALKRYDDAAAVLYAVLSVGPGWDWATLIGLYPDVDTYTAQLRTLEAACTTDPKSAADRLVLAYQYLAQGHNEAAVAALKQVVSLNPSDALSAKLVKQLAPAPAASPSEPALANANAAAPTTTTTPPADTTPPAGATLPGRWTAHPDSKTTVALDLQPDGKFAWDVTSGGKTQQFHGTSTSGDGLLTLAQENGPVLVGRVTWTDPTHMTFRIAGDGPDDPGLRFAR